MERYEELKDIGSGKFGVAKLVRDKWSGEFYAVKYIERGPKVLDLSFFVIIFAFDFAFCLFSLIMAELGSFSSLWNDFCGGFLGFVD